MPDFRCHKNILYFTPHLRLLDGGILPLLRLSPSISEVIFCRREHDSTARLPSTFRFQNPNSSRQAPTGRCGGWWRADVGSVPLVVSWYDGVVAASYETLKPPNRPLDAYRGTGPENFSHRRITNISRTATRGHGGEQEKGWCFRHQAGTNSLSGQNIPGLATRTQTCCRVFEVL